MADSILRLKVSSEEYDNKLKRAAEGLQRYADECRKAGGTLEHLDDGVLEFTKSLGNMDTVSKSAKGSINEMTKTFTELSVVYNRLTDEEKAAPFGKALADSLNTLKGRIQEGKTELDDISKSLNGGGGMKDALDAVAGKFGLSTDLITKFGGVVGVTTTALKVAKDAFLQSESNIDEWGRTLKGAEGAYDVFLQTLNNGNWSNFFSNLSQAITGARDLYDAFDRLNSIKANNAVAIATTQAEIQQLRLLKQQGQDVDDKIKDATSRLAALQAQSANAGINAGRTQVTTTLRNGVNSIGGAQINDATLNRVADNISKQGQAYFDYMKRRAAALEKQGMVTKTQTINDSQGGTYERQYKVFDISALSQEQQKQYAIAKTVTERETEIQKGLSVWSQAVQEQTSATREQFKGNRYALQGSGSSGGNSSSGGTTAPAYAADSIAAQSALVSELTKKWNEAGETMRTSYLYELIQAENKLKEMKDEQSDLRNQEQARLGMNSVTTDLSAGLSDSLGLMPTLESIQEQLDKKPLIIHVETVDKDIKAIAKSAQITSQMVGTIGQAFNAIEDPAAKVAGTIAMSIANIAMAYSQALANDPTLKTSIYGLIAAAAASTISMATTIASLHSSTGYAEGGMIKGNSYSGDNIGGLVDGSQLVGLNAGEIVLNQAMAGNVARGLEANAGGRISVVGEIQGEKIVLVANRYFKRTGQGEIVTWR